MSYKKKALSRRWGRMLHLRKIRRRMGQTAGSPENEEISEPTKKLYGNR